MSEVVRLSDDGNCIHVRSDGEPSLDELRQSLSAIQDLRLAHGIDRVLVDSRARSAVPPMPELLEGGRALAQMLGSRVRVAVLVQVPSDDHMYFRLSALHRGGQVNYFLDEASALQWLMQDERTGS